MKLKAGEAHEGGRSHIINRPRLTRLLDESKARIILLVAPAGYGKTTLAREWLSTRPHAWYQGTSATADVAALAHGLAKAAATIVPEVGDRMAMRLRVSSAPNEEAEGLAELLAEDLSDWPSDAWLAFDDYQFACDSAPAERFVERLIFSSPLRLLLAGRSRPNWATARRLLYGQIDELGRSLLAMSQDEARFALRARSVDETSGLLSLADGWPALIGLAAVTAELDIPGQGIPDELYSFFAEELYQAASPTTQEGLRPLSLIRSITLEFAKAIVGKGATAIIDESTKLGFFLQQSREGLELHPLLRSFLVSKFNEGHVDADRKVILRLVELLIAREDWDHAFELISQFYEEPLIVQLLDVGLPRMLEEGRLSTLKEWIAFAVRRNVDSPVLDFAEAEVMLRAGDSTRSEVLALQAARHFESDHFSKSKTLWVAGTSAHLTSRDSVALEHFSAAVQTARTEADANRALWGQFLATATLERELEADLLLTAFIEKSGDSVDELLRVATGRFRMASLLGRVREALATYEPLALLRDRSRDPLIQSAFLNAYVALLTMSGRYEDALRTVKIEIAIANRYSLEFVIPLARYHAAAAKWGTRAFRACGTDLAFVTRVAAGTQDDFLSSNVAILRARLQLTSGAPAEAVEVLEQHRSSTRDSAMHPEYLAWRSLARSVNGDIQEATRLARKAIALSRRIEVTAPILWARTIAAFENGGSPQSAHEKAFRTALDTGHIDAFVTAYRACPELLQLLAKNEANHDRLKTILERARDHSLAESVGLRLPSAPAQDGPSLLSKREREVFELVTQGMTNKDIGRALFITESTAKAHVRKICQKLGARTRTEAAARAAELSD
jgi:ATP/maltotriose-dependent transcriptional regulator MalT